MTLEQRVKPEKSIAWKEGGNQKQGYITHVVLFSVFLRFLYLGWPWRDFHPQGELILRANTGVSWKFAFHMQTTHIPPNSLLDQALALQAAIPLAQDQVSGKTWGSYILEPAESIQTGQPALHAYCLSHSFLQTPQ